MKRAAAIGGFILATFVLINYFEFYSWFYNNEIPAYVRFGVLHGDAAEPIRAFYEAARDACAHWRADLVEECRRYQVALLGDATYVRPVSSAAGVLLTALSAKIEFMQALKFAIIACAIGSAILCGLLALPFLSRLDTRVLAAIGLAWVGGWLVSRPLHVAGANVLLAVFTLGAIALAACYLRLHGMPSLSVMEPRKREAWADRVQIFTLGLQWLAIGLCFFLGYRIHLLFESKFPLLYLLLSLGSWPFLRRALQGTGNWILAGFLSAVLYLAAVLLPIFYDLNHVKHHQLILAGIFLFIAIWRDDSRMFFALPLILLFDMQNGARVSALVIVGESLVGLFRRRIPATLLLVAAVTAAIGVTVTATTAVYPFDERLYNVADAVAVLTAPIVLMAAFVALMILSPVATKRLPQVPGPVAFDRMLVYAASIVVMAGIQIRTQGLLFDAFQLSNLFLSVAVAPALALFFTVFALLFTTHRASTSNLDRWNAVAAIAALVLVMSTAKGRPISFAQLNEGVRASLGRYLPADWHRRTPYMTLADNTVYYDMNSLATGALMQYSMIKILLLSRKLGFSRRDLTIRPFGRAR